MKRSQGTRTLEAHVPPAWVGIVSKAWRVMGILILLGPEISGARVVVTLLYAGRELMAFGEERQERTQSTCHQPWREDGMGIFLSR